MHLVGKEMLDCLYCAKSVKNRAELKKNVAELSIGIAETVIKKELSSKKDQLKLVEETLKDVTLN